MAREVMTAYEIANMDTAHPHTNFEHCFAFGYLSAMIMGIDAILNSNIDDNEAKLRRIKQSIDQVMKDTCE